MRLCLKEMSKLKIYYENIEERNVFIIKIVKIIKVKETAAVTNYNYLLVHRSQFNWDYTFFHQVISPQIYWNKGQRG